MPYINIKEADITPVASFDTIENAVLIFGFDFHRYSDVNAKTDPKELFKIYTSAADLYKDIKVSKSRIGTLQDNYPFSNFYGSLYRPFVTAYDCLLRGLPVVYVPIDDYIGNEFTVTSHLLDSEGNEQKFIEYGWLGLENPRSFNTGLKNIIPDKDTTESQFVASYWGRLGFKFAPWTETIYEDNEDYKEIKRIYDTYISGSELAAYNALGTLLAGEGIQKLPLDDKIHMPITFITTCGYEGFVVTEGDETVWSIIMGCLNGRKDVLYLYDIKPDVVPEDVKELALKFSPGELVNIVYPWGTYNSYLMTQHIHMPGSYGYLMAYAASIKNNMPWLAVAGINRGIIPNIVNIDYKVRESMIHSWQGDSVYAGADVVEDLEGFRVNPIVDLGSNYGKVIFGNRTCYNDTSNSTVVFKQFLNVRLLLIYIHKQAFKVSVRHLFEPNDDIVWLSFKQKVNTLLDQMVSGRGLKWYKWQRIRPEDDPSGNPKLGQIRARLTIRPIEAVESFDITITMTDSDIEITY